MSLQLATLVTAFAAGWVCCLVCLVIARAARRALRHHSGDFDATTAWMHHHAPQEPPLQQVGTRWYPRQPDY